MLIFVQLVILLTCQISFVATMFLKNNLSSVAFYSQTYTCTQQVHVYIVIIYTLYTCTYNIYVYYILYIYIYILYIYIIYLILPCNILFFIYASLQNAQY